MAQVPAMSGMRVPGPTIEKLLLDILARERVDGYCARHVAAGLVQASLRGVDSHGVRLFPHYVRALRAGRINPAPTFRFEGKYPAAATLYADQAFGHGAGARAMEHAIERSTQAGVCAVAVRDSSHFGAAAYFALLAAGKGLVGMSFTNADSLVVPTGGVRPFFGTNPICFAAPVAGARPFCLDMATSLWNWNNVKRCRESGKPLPSGVAVDGQGHPTSDAQAARALSPAGGYKGYGLGAMVDILCALLPGGPFGPQLLPMFTSPLENPRHIGHFFVAMRPDAFSGGADLPQRMAEMLQRLRAEPASAPGTPVKAAGDPEWDAMELRSKEGIPLSETEQKEMEAVAKESGAALPWVA